MSLNLTSPRDLIREQYGIEIDIQNTPEGFQTILSRTLADGRRQYLKCGEVKIADYKVVCSRRVGLFKFHEYMATDWDALNRELEIRGERGIQELLASTP